MKKIGFKLLGIVLNGVARLPFKVLYPIADAIAWLLSNVVRYRKRLVLKNIADSFPELADADHRRIAKEFYKNFADYIVETLKLLHISDEEMSQRMQFENLELLDGYLAEGRSVVAYFSHCGNWEWAPSVTLHSRLRDCEKVAYCQVYRPLRNQWFDAFMLSLRSRFGSVSFPKKTVLRSLLTLRRDGVVSVTGFMSDQKPSTGDDGYITEFLHHPTAFITGTSVLAHRLGMAAIYWDMEKLGRGHYKIVMREIAADASTVDPDALTDAYVRALETTIRRNPAIWLWSHNRWKNPVVLP